MKLTSRGAPSPWPLPLGKSSEHDIITSRKACSRDISCHLPVSYRSLSIQPESRDVLGDQRRGIGGIFAIFCDERYPKFAEMDLRTSGTIPWPKGWRGVVGLRWVGVAGSVVQSESLLIDRLVYPKTKLKSSIGISCSFEPRRPSLYRGPGLRVSHNKSPYA